MQHPQPNSLALSASPMAALAVVRAYGGKLSSSMKWLRVFALLALSQFACSVDYSNEDSAPAVQALSSTGLSVSLTYQSDWKAGYCSNVSITNTGQNSISAWQVVINLGQAQLSQLWKGTTSLTGPRMTVTPSSENSQVGAGATASFGFCANAAGPSYHPTLVSAASTTTASELVGSRGGCLLFCAARKGQFLHSKNAYRPLQVPR